MLDNLIATNCSGYFSCFKTTLWNLFLSLGIAFFSLGLGSTLVAVYIHKEKKYYENLDKNSDLDSLDNESIETETSKEYCERYWQAYKDLKSEDISEEKIQEIDKVFVKDELPFWGETVMTYNHDFHGYYYFNDKGGSIPYKMLGTVARKFVTLFNCKNLYVNIEDELEISKAILKEINNRLSMTNQENNDDEFFVKKKVKNNLSTEKANEYLVKGNFIKFKYKGKISDCDLINTKKELNEKKKESVLKIDFETFKKMSLEKKNELSNEVNKNDFEKEKEE